MPQPSGRGRIDAPQLFAVLYLSSAAAGAVAEAFGRLDVWSASMLREAGSTGAMRVVAEYELSDSTRVLDLDDVASLAELVIRPSEVVTRDRAVTQAWAIRAYRKRRWAGIRWWSYYDPRWYAYGLWDISKLRFREADVLSSTHPALLEAASVLKRTLV